MEWALARVDDLVNWGRFETLALKYFCLSMAVKNIFSQERLSMASDIWVGLLCCGDDAHSRT